MVAALWNTLKTTESYILYEILCCVIYISKKIIKGGEKNLLEAETLGGSS